MQRLTNLLQKMWHTKALRKKLLFTATMFLIFRFLAHVPLPGVDLLKLGSIFENNQFLNLLNIFSGGTLSNFSIVAVGINPYITASIIIQLATMVFPKLKEIQKDGESGRERINQYTRLASVPLAIIQSVSVLTLLRSQELIQIDNPLLLVGLIATLVAGSMIVLWLGELVSLYGIGNGISMILLGGILSRLPVTVAELFTTGAGDQSFTAIIVLALFIAIIAMVVFMNESVRKVTIQYAKRQRGSRVYGDYMTHLPIRVNVSGVMPIIFALSIMIAPSFIGRLLVASQQVQLVILGQKLQLWFAQTNPVYIVSYFLVVFFFSFFSALIFFNAEDLSSELKKSGAFLPGVRPGAATKKYLEFVVNRITLAGAFFLGFIAILPSLVQNATGIQSLALGGTSALIVVSVILETAKQVESMLVEQNYDQYR
jgi:preprotein translocase subunit SecY